MQIDGECSVHGYSDRHDSIVYHPSHRPSSSFINHQSSSLITPHHPSFTVTTGWSWDADASRIQSCWTTLTLTLTFTLTFTFIFTFTRIDTVPHPHARFGILANGTLMFIFRLHVRSLYSYMRVKQKTQFQYKKEKKEQKRGRRISHDSSMVMVMRSTCI